MCLFSHSFTFLSDLPDILTIRSICLWHTGKKKPIHTASFAHGFSKTISETEGEITKPRWITSLAALRGTDLFVSGSSSGFIKVWAIAPTLKSFTHLFDLPAQGFVNSLQLLAVPPRNVQPDKWVDDKLRKRQQAIKVKAKKARRFAKRHGQGQDAEMKDQDGTVAGEGMGDDGQQGAGADQHSPMANGHSQDEEMDYDSSDDELDEENGKVAKLERKLAPSKVEPEILLVASLAREPRLGRWDVLNEKGVRNGALVVHLGKQKA